MSAPVQTESTTPPDPVTPAAPAAENIAPLSDFAKFAAPVTPATRLVSLDAYRGFIMLVMASSSLAIPQVVKTMFKTPAELDQHPVWKFLAFHTDHVPWEGCSFWDLIQPSFMFMVGVALPYSYASRVAKGQSTVKIFGHALFRSFLLIALGIFLSSNWSKQTNFTFVNVLTQIGMGYFFLYFFVGRGLVVQLLGLMAILGGYWLWFYNYPLPPDSFNFQSVGLPTDWPLWTGQFSAHFNKNVNAAAGFDQWFLNLFPYAETKNPITKEVMTHFVFNSGGYQTLNFIPSLGTMLLGLMAGEMLRSMQYTNIEKFLRLMFAGFVCLVIGILLNETTVCPSVKRIWTPSWALYSSGWTFFMLAGFYLVIDLWGVQKWAWPFVVVGMNSIAIYCMSQLIRGWIGNTLQIHFGKDVYKGTYFGYFLFDPVFAPIAQAVLVLLVMWLICVWMYRQKIFIRI